MFGFRRFFIIAVCVILYAPEICAGCVRESIVVPCRNANYESFFNKENTVFIVNRSINLRSASITIGKGSAIKFTKKRSCLKNGSVNFNNCELIGVPKFQRVNTISGSVQNDTICSAWFSFNNPYSELMQFLTCFSGDGKHLVLKPNYKYVVGKTECNAKIADVSRLTINGNNATVYDEYSSQTAVLENKSREVLTFLRCSNVEIINLKYENVNGDFIRHDSDSYGAGCTFIHFTDCQNLTVKDVDVKNCFVTVSIGKSSFNETPTHAFIDCKIDRGMYGVSLFGISDVEVHLDVMNEITRSVFSAGISNAKYYINTIGDIYARGTAGFIMQEYWLKDTKGNIHNIHNKNITAIVNHYGAVIRGTSVALGNFGANSTGNHQEVLLRQHPFYVSFDIEVNYLGKTSPHMLAFQVQALLQKDGACQLPTYVEGKLKVNYHKCEFSEPQESIYKSVSLSKIRREGEDSPYIYKNLDIELTSDIPRIADVAINWNKNGLFNIHCDKNTSLALMVENNSDNPCTFNIDAPELELNAYSKSGVKGKLANIKYSGPNLLYKKGSSQNVRLTH